MELEVIGILSVVTPKFLSHFREENLIMLEGEYEEEFVLEAPGSSERVCYCNHRSGPSWMWMYDVLIMKLGIRIPFTHFQVTILQQIEAASSQLHPKSWAMIWGFEIICEYLEMSPSPKTFFFFFTLTRPTGGSLTTA